MNETPQQTLARLKADQDARLARDGYLSRDIRPEPVELFEDRVGTMTVERSVLSRVGLPAVCGFVVGVVVGLML